MSRFALHMRAVSSSALQMYQRLIEVLGAPVSYVHRRVRFYYWINALRVLNSSTALA